LELEGIRAKLRNYLEASGHSSDYIDFQLSSLFDDSALRSRLEEFLLMSKPPSKESTILVSGCSVGGELQTLLDKGYSNLAGTEILDIYIEICKLRFADKVNVKKVSDELMPFESNSVGGIFSAHIVEHTRNPKLYVLELLRLLHVGGLMYLEFPTRYNLVELHTGTFSFEWLPTPLRYFLLTFLSRFAPSKQNRVKYYSVRNTLRPIGVGMVLRFARRGGYEVYVEGRQRISGIERLTVRVIGKKQSR